jgi:hypothetical protein
MAKTTTIEGLQEPEDTPQVFSNSEEPLNSTSLENATDSSDGSIPFSHFGCGCDNKSVGSMSPNRVFVLSESGKPLTPCKPSKARRLLEGKVAKPIWNKFGLFGIQMLVKTREYTPKTVLGVDNGTKFEGYSVVSEKENNLNVMWKLPDKKTIVRKLIERRQLRRAKRWRNCRRREARFDNRKREGFIAPSQLVIVNSRLKCLKELFTCYPISKVGIEDVRFNHRDKRWGKNFSTVEIGKTMIKDFLINRVGRENYLTFDGFETKDLREKKGLKKSTNKSAEHFHSHCVDSFAIASEIVNNPNHRDNILIVDDTYRPTRRRLHDTQPSKGGIRERYSTGNFMGIRKGSICEFGQIVGGTKNNLWIRDQENKRIGRTSAKISWLSHRFKVAIHPPIEIGGLLATEGVI